MKIYVVRHGETDWNNMHLVQGLINNPLNEKGREQAKNISCFFKGKSIKNFYSSPLDRAVETLEIIKKENNFTSSTITLDGFKERDFGSLEGAQVKDFLNIKNPENEPKYEKNVDLEKRVMEAFEIVLASGEDSIITAHAHVLKAILVNVDSTFNYSYMLKNCAILCIENRKGQLILEKIS